MWSPWSYEVFSFLWQMGSYCKHVHNSDLNRKTAFQRCLSKLIIIFHIVLSMHIWSGRYCRHNCRSIYVRHWSFCCMLWYFSKVLAFQYRLKARFCWYLWSVHLFFLRSFYPFSASMHIDSMRSESIWCSSLNSLQLLNGCFSSFSFFSLFVKKPHFI